MKRKDSYALGIAASVMLLSFCVLQLAMGMHDLDLAYNMDRMEAASNMGFADLSNQGNWLSSGQLHAIGMSKVLSFIPLIAVLGIFVGFFTNGLRKAK